MIEQNVGSTAFLMRANPLAKLVAVAVLTVALTLSLDWVSGTVVLLALALVYPLSGRSWRMLAQRGWPLLVAVLLAGWATALTASDSGATLLDLGYARVSQGSLASGIAITVRGLAFVWSAMMLVLTTDPSDLASALAQSWRLPARFVLGALAAMRLLGLMAEEWQTISMARRARGVGSTGGLVSRVSAYLGLGLALLISSVRRAARLAVTMEARGFGSNQRTWWHRYPVRVSDVALACGAIVVGVIAVLTAVSLGTWRLLGIRL